MPILYVAPAGDANGNEFAVVATNSYDGVEWER